MEPQDDVEEGQEDSQDDAKEDQEDGQEQDAALSPVGPNPEYPDQIRLGCETFGKLSDEIRTNPTCRMRSDISGRGPT